MSNETVLTKQDLRRMNRRFMPLAVNTYNYTYQQAGSTVFALAPALRKIYKNDEDYKKSLKNHYAFFNTHPWLMPLLLGATLAMEDNDGLDSLEAVHSFKTGLMGPLAGVGDTIFWILYPTIMGSISGYMAIEGNIIGSLIWILMNIALMFVRVRVAEFGYAQGTQLIHKLGDNLSKLTDSISMLGLVIAGALVPSVVKINTALAINIGEVSMDIQSMLDRIVPFLLPVVVTTLCYRAIKEEKISVSMLILIVVVISMILAGLGVLV